ncbi:RNA polymerase sigma-70 factor (sigma-E family) [Nocardioides aromaticivorans]|uniref:RNA polymerase sigma-70 factor (Sigma-E family) n=1 Tax=Nocardioides aromaticivorans TaxID=200618 RepID=A0A7Z0CME9_9ACTN|nr:SigE family RNA polymerase sigma factor [Nocardioides aromaticivorans]NYI43770.1 RNA polymerase sigma-70 factor (sigma-E family) [Nocardioides aromaticivorans]
MQRTVVEQAMPQGAVPEDGFDGFVAARGDALWRSAWLLTGDHQLAEDLVQTALAKSWRAWSRVGADGFEAYVRRVMYTTYVSWWRRKWRGERPTEHLPERPAAVEDRDGRNDLVAALGALPRGQRAVVVLRYFEDLTEQQTAAALGIGVGTVKSQCSRALAALRSSPHLRREETDDE